MPKKNSEQFSFADDTPPKPASAKKDPAQLLLDWLPRWRQPTITERDIRIWGPPSIRNRESAIRSAETLVAHGWLVPTNKRRYGARAWEIVRRPIVHPTL